VKLHEHQEAAIIKSTGEDRLVLIQGGAGTGKTTIIAQIITRLESQGHSVELCAPTGKAAARLREATGYSASTIHRLLGYNTLGFTRETLVGITVIIDEGTMVPTWMLHEITKRQPVRVVLVGDSAQLPPVDAGQPFHDLVTHRDDLVAELTHCYRASESVYQAATAIRHGKAPGRSAKSPSERWLVQDCGSIEATHEAVIDMVRRNEIEFRKGADVILAPRNGKRGEFQPGTVYWLNYQIARLLIPRDDETFICIGDRVINTENNADKDIWNGTTATVEDIEPDGVVWIETDQPVKGEAGDQTTRVRLTKGEARKLDLGYALSVHKSQGSQYERVVFVCHRKDAFSLTRSLIYTAVTRTKRECIVVGDYAALCAGINKVSAKQTVLAHLLTNGATS